MDKVKRIQELRRSNAATPLRNKKKYNRKEKYKSKLDNQLKLCASLVKSTRRYDWSKISLEFFCDISHGTNRTNVFTIDYIKQTNVALVKSKLICSELTLVWLTVS